MKILYKIVFMAVFYVFLCQCQNDKLQERKQEIQAGKTLNDVNRDTQGTIKINLEKEILEVDAKFLMENRRLNIPENDKETLSHYAGKFEVNCKEKIVCEIYGNNLKNHCTDFESYEIIYKYACKYFYLEKKDK